ncbi:uncharacterized protein LOC117329239 isoform X2 [Pecten maximus]|uniref:uncharacterized protein LOC117329239 isoform X2 n=1 Tax=Pecten maximus TaxID=6579 RepID=UPI001457F474|nr:uncharacterized protein LOC117329239 isoform X2 [Pecten maximus]
MDLNECQSQYQEIQGRTFLPMKEEYVCKDYLMDMSEFQKQKPYSKVYVPNMESRLRFYKFMDQDPETWATKEDADLALKESTENLTAEQKLVDAEKEHIDHLIEKTVGEYEALQNNLQLIGKKLQVFTEKKTKLENLKSKAKRSAGYLGRGNHLSFRILYPQEAAGGEACQVNGSYRTVSDDHQ